jgi:hypothetical protein
MSNELRAYNALLKRLAVISTEAPVSAFLRKQERGPRNDKKIRFVSLRGAQRRSNLYPVRKESRFSNGVYFGNKPESGNPEALSQLKVHFVRSPYCVEKMDDQV